MGTPANDREHHEGADPEAPPHVRETVKTLFILGKQAGEIGRDKPARLHALARLGG